MPNPAKANNAALAQQKGWVYICMDIKKPDECKIGMTKRALYRRITETGNPDYMIVKAYHVCPTKVAELEKRLQRELARWYKQKKHFLTGRISEWFLCSPAQAAAQIEHALAEFIGFQDTAGKPNLSSIVFKPEIADYPNLFFADRIDDHQSYLNLISAIRDA